MLNPFKDRVLSTYALMQTFIEKSSSNASELIAQRSKARKEMMREINLPLSWSLDTTVFTMITFKGYEQAFKTSEATGLQRLYYDHNKPYTKQVKYYNL